MAMAVAGRQVPRNFRLTDPEELYGAGRRGTGRGEEPLLNSKRRQRTAVDIGTLSPEQLQDGAEKAFRNGSCYLKEAELVHQVGSPDHAVALLLCATEEFSKAEMLTVLGEGIKEVPDSTATWKRGYLRFTSPPRRMWHHRDKFWYFRNYVALGGLLRQRIGAAKSRKYCHMVIHDSSPTTIDWLLGVREAGFYVDYVGEGVWMSPLDLTQPMGFEVIDYVRGYGRWVRNARKEGWSKNSEAILAEVKAVLGPGA